MTPLQREALQMCLEYIETDAHERRHVRWKINEALAQPQQEPVAWMTQARNFVHLCEFTEKEAKLYGWSAVYTSPPAQRKPLPKDEWPKHPSPYWNGEHLGFSKSDLTDYAMQVLAVHGVKENT